MTVSGCGSMAPDYTILSINKQVGTGGQYSAATGEASFFLGGEGSLLLAAPSDADVFLRSNTSGQEQMTEGAEIHSGLIYASGEAAPVAAEQCGG